jgi:hypothetical protein
MKQWEPLMMDKGSQLARSPQETARAAGVSKASVDRAIRAVLLHAHKWGRRTIILDSDLVAYIEGLPITA